jgi:hypothetical protein
MPDPFDKPDPFTPPAHAALGSVPPAAQHAPLQIDPLASAGAGPALPKGQFKVQGTYNYPNKAEPTWLNATMETETLEMAQQIAALYPKALGVTGRPLHTRDAAGNPVVKGLVGMTAKLGSDKNIGDVNEAGLKRYQRFLKTAEKLGHRIGIESASTGVGIKNAYSTFDELHQAIGLPPYSPPQE